MTADKPYVNLEESQEGYITDTVADGIRPTDTLDIKNIELKLLHLPDFATITFDVELLNISEYWHSIFTIASYASSANLDLTHSITNSQLTFPADHRTERFFRLVYTKKNFQIPGEQVRIKYNGKCTTKYFLQSQRNTFGS